MNKDARRVGWLPIITLAIAAGAVAATSLRSAPAPGHRPAVLGGGTSGPAAAGLPRLVFVSRHPIRGEDGAPEPGEVPGVGPRGRTAAVGGQMLVREPGGELRELVGRDRLFDVSDPCVSWDGGRVVFSGLVHPDSAWRIFVVNADGSGLRVITRTDRSLPLDQFGPAAARFARYDDVDPCWLPDGRICFASTRYPMLSEQGVHLASNLFVIGEDGAALHRITSERNGAEEPVVDLVTGRIVYARWWLNLDRPSDVAQHGITFREGEALSWDVGDLWQTVSISPDGRGTRLHAGDPRTREGMRCYKPGILPDGRVLALYPANPSLVPGPGPMGLRLFQAGASEPHDVIGFLPDGAGAPGAGPRSSDPATAPSVADAVALSGGWLLISWAPRPGADFGLAVCGEDGSNLETVLDLPGTHELDGAVLAPRPIPPVLVDELEPGAAELPPTEDPTTFVRGGTFRFDCLNIFANAPVDAPIPDAPVITRGARVRFFLNFQRTNPAGRDPSVLYRDAPVTPRGAIHENEIPADIPVFDQLVDAYGHVLRTSSRAFAHLTGFGSARRSGWAQCVGCHAGHSLQTVPGNFSSAEWFNCSPSARVEATSAWRPRGAAEAPCPPRRVVDRRARSDSLSVAWVAAGDSGQSVTLHWSIPVEVSRLVLYGIRPNPSAGTDVVVEDCRVTLYLGGKITGCVPHSGRVVPEGSEVRVPPTLADAAKIEVLQMNGRIAGQALAGLAEVETIARLPLD